MSPCVKAVFSAVALLAFALVMGACSGTSPSPTPSPSISIQATKVIEITVKGRSVSPPPARVDVAQGQPVRLIVHSDAPDEVHVHGYDIEKPVGPGQDAVIEFAATQTGLFEVETHESGLLLTQLAVR